VHYTAAHHYDPGRARFQDFDPFWEFVSGPLHAGTGPVRPAIATWPKNWSPAAGDRPACPGGAAFRNRTCGPKVWLTADVHYTAAHHYDPGRARFQDFDPFWEFVSGVGVGGVLERHRHLPGPPGDRDVAEELEPRGGRQDPGRARFQDFDPFWEFVSGPLHAGTGEPNALDDTFGPQVRIRRDREPPATGRCRRRP
jgi:phosphodiesterase/alkaline phosphatase D-like protein